MFPSPSIRWVIVATLVSGVLGCRTITVSEKTFFRPVKVGVVAPTLTPGSVPVSFTMADGVVLHGFWAPVASPRATLLYFCGAGCVVEDEMATLVNLSQRLRVNLLTYDYRGAGRSEGTASIAASHADAVEVVAKWRSWPDAGPNRLVVLGVSMGAMAAVELAALNTVPFAAVLLDSAATNVNDWADNLLPWYGKPFVTVKVAPAMAALSAEKAVTRFSEPLLLLVGDADTVTPPHFSQRLLAAAASRVKALHVFPGVEHGEASTRPEYGAVLAAFLDKALTESSASLLEPAR